MKLYNFRVNFETKNSISKNALTSFTVKAKNYGQAEKKALSSFDKKEKMNCLISIEKLKNEIRNNR
jgi:hypothetical protein